MFEWFHRSVMVPIFWAIGGDAVAVTQAALRLSFLGKGHIKVKCFRGSSTSSLFLPILSE